MGKRLLAILAEIFPSIGTFERSRKKESKSAIKDINAGSKSKVVTVSFDANKTNKENISKVINAAGYDTEISKSDNKHDCETDMKKEEKKD